MTPERIQELRALCNKATEGPWVMWSSDLVMAAMKGQDYTEPSVLSRGIVCAIDDEDDGIDQSEAQNNRKFIAAARTALPEALDEIERLNSARTILKSGLDTALKCGDVQRKKIEELEDRLATTKDTYMWEHRCRIDLERAKQLLERDTDAKIKRLTEQLEHARKAHRPGWAESLDDQLDRAIDLDDERDRRKNKT